MNTSRFHEHLTSDDAEPVRRQDATDIISQIREATCAPSPLTGYLKDPAVIHALDSPESTRSRRKATSIFGVVLAEEEKQAHRLKSLLRLTGDRLDREIRRGGQTVTRAEQAETRVEELVARVSKAESSRYIAELEAARAKEEVKRYRLQIERLERDVKRLQSDVVSLERARQEAEESGSRARHTARTLLNQTRSERDLGRLEGYQSGYDDGYQRGLLRQGTTR